MSGDDLHPAVVVVGVESTGKTTLCEAIADATGWTLVPEIARRWLAERDGRYAAEDLDTLADLQMGAELEARRDGPAVVDTDALVIRVWGEVRFGGASARVHDALARRPDAHYLLPALDLPWVADPLRESPDPDEREMLHARYRALLCASGHRWAEVGGSGDVRTARAMARIRRWGLLP